MRRLQFLCGAVLCLAGCTNLDAVTSASSGMVNASKSWNSVAAELSQTCKRQQQYNRVLECADPAAISERLVKENAILAKYFQALADTASDQHYTVDAGLTTLAQSVAAIPGIDAGEVSAAADLAGVIAKWATAAARERALRALIDEGVPPAKRLVAAMQTYVAPSVARGLHGEEDEMDRVFEGYIYPDAPVELTRLHQMCDVGPRAFDLGREPFLAALEYCHRRAGLEGEITAVDDYKLSLATVEKILDDLASSKSRLTAKALIIQLYGDSVVLVEKVDAVSKAFSQRVG